MSPSNPSLQSSGNPEEEEKMKKGWRTPRKQCALNQHGGCTSDFTETKTAYTGIVVVFTYWSPRAPLP